MVPNRSADWAPVSPPSTSIAEVGATGCTGAERENGEELQNVSGKEEERCEAAKALPLLEILGTGAPVYDLNGEEEPTEYEKRLE